jgi:hypothetical protein
MKNGAWIGGLIFAAIGGVAELRGQDLQWRAIADSPAVDAPAIVLEAPVALPAMAVTQSTPIAPLPMPTTDEIQTVSYQTASSVGGVEPKPRSSLPDIIAVSAPLTNTSPSPAVEEDDSNETLFAVDRPLRRMMPARVANGGIARTSANSVGDSDAGTAELPMVPGWEAPQDASWGLGMPTSPLPDGAEGAFGYPGSVRRPRLYGGSEYLLWWIQGQSVPVLATTGSPTQFGILGAPTTQILYGGNQIGTNPFSGGRFTLGYWLDDERTKGIEITGFFLGTNSSSFSTNSSMNPVIARPFLEVNNGQESAQLTALPGVGVGALTINAPTSLWGLESNLRCLMCCGCNYRIYAIAGFRNINLDESLSITENVQGLPTAEPPFTNQAATVNDYFGTQNHFYGGQVGLDARWYWGRWSIEGRGKVAIGDTAQILDISGSQRFVSPTGVVQNFTGGLFALPSNIGHFSHNAFSVIPEIGLNLGYQILPNLRGYVGYNFLYWSNVIRPGTSIDRGLDVTQIPNFPLNPEPAPVPGLHPAPIFHEVGIWAQGITAGFEYNY